MNPVVKFVVRAVVAYGVYRIGKYCVVKSIEVKEKRAFKKEHRFYNEARHARSAAINKRNMARKQAYSKTTAYTF